MQRPYGACPTRRASKHTRTRHARLLQPMPSIISMNDDRIVIRKRPPFLQVQGDAGAPSKENGPWPSAGPRCARGECAADEMFVLRSSDPP